MPLLRAMNSAQDQVAIPGRTPKSAAYAIMRASLRVQLISIQPSFCGQIEVNRSDATRA